MERKNEFRFMVTNYNGEKRRYATPQIRTPNK